MIKQKTNKKEKCLAEQKRCLYEINKCMYKTTSCFKLNNTKINYTKWYTRRFEFLISVVKHILFLDLLLYHTAMYMKILVYE